MGNKKVTVLLPVYNGAKYLRTAIKSILAQTFKDYELLIINDGSFDDSDGIVKSFNDPRIRYLENVENIGLIKTLNIGIEESKSQYIARMDQDDISLPKRLEKQINFMDRNESIGICGCYTKVFGEGVKSVKAKFPTNNEVIRSTVLFNTAIPHPTMVIRKKLLDKFNIRYRDYPNVEDLAFCSECSHHFKMVNLPEVLLKYRISDTSIQSINSMKKREQVFLKIYENGLTKLGINPNRDELKLHYEISTRTFEREFEFLDRAEEWLSYLKSINLKTNIYDSSAFAQVVSLQWYKICCELALVYGFRVFKRFYESLLINNTFGKKILTAKLLYKCIK